MKLNKEYMGLNGFVWWFGVVEDRADPLMIGRVRVRIHGFHTPNKVRLPTDDLPWAQIIMPPTSATTSEIGQSPTGLIEGSVVFGFFLDGERAQRPMIFGSIATVPAQSVKEILNLASPAVTTTNQSQTLITPDVSAQEQSMINLLQQRGIDDAQEIANILAQIKGETNFISTDENLNYSPKRLFEIFGVGNVFGNTPKFNTLEQAAQVVDQGEEAIGNAIYGGRSGNSSDEGYLYRGRGLIQLTGKDNYKKYGNRLNLNLVDYPHLALEPAIAQRIAVEYFVDAKNRGVDLSNITEVGSVVGYATGSGETRRRAVISNNYYNQLTGQPLQAETSLLLDYNKNIGFADPYGVYPTEGNAPSTSRLAQNFTSAENHHVIKTKKQQRLTNIPTGSRQKLSSVSVDLDEQLYVREYWSEPEPRYDSNDPNVIGALYPFNHVKQTESGHVFEVDDTPGARRIHNYHAAGTFEEIQNDGTKITKVVGDTYSIYIKDNNVYVKGNCNVTVAGDCNLICAGDLIQEVQNYHLTVHGSMYTKIEGNEYKEVLSDYSHQINGEVNIRNSQNTNCTFGKSVNTRIGNDNKVAVLGYYRVFANNILSQTKKNYAILSGGTFDIGSIGRLSIGGNGDVKIKAAENAEIKATRIDLNKN
jgi:predicted chitinase